MIDSIEGDTGSESPDLKKARRQKAAATGGLKLDRLPPHSIEAEQGVLGCVLLSPNDCIGICIEKFKVGSEVFYDLRHRTIYELLAEMYDHKEAIDLLTVQQRLKDRNQLEAVGGLTYLSALPDAVPSADVLDALRDGAGLLLESIRLFDVFADPERLGADRKSLAFSLRFRAADRTLTVDEAAVARDAAVARAAELHGAQLRT